MRPYFEDEDVVLYHGDCLDVMPHLDPIDLVVTSPPYNMGIGSGGNGRGVYRAGGTKAKRFRDGYVDHADAMTQEDYDTWQRECLAAMWRLARLGVFYNHRPRLENGVQRLPLDLDFGGVPLRQIIVWDRGTGININLRSFCTRQEWVLLFAKPEFALVDHSASGMGDVWRLGMETRETGHPAPFPVTLPERALRATGAQTVLDPFVGSGTTLVAAKAIGVRAIGVELSERYCELAVERLRQGSLFGSQS